MKQIRKHLPTFLRARRLFAAALAAAPLWAQTAATVPAPASDEVVQLEPVTVTATLREKPLQEVPLAVSVVDGARAEQANRNTLFAIASEVPALTFRTNSSNKDTSLFIRGVGTVTTSPGVEPSVSTVVDGVVLARPGQATLDLFDVQRIEVLRGPQGTLFGKNATAGVVNIVTRAPSKETTGYVDTSYFEGDEFRLRAGVSGEVSPDFARVSVNALYGYFDGNVKNLYDGDVVNGYEKSGVRSKLELRPSERLVLTFAGDFLASEEDNAAVPVATGTVAYPTGVFTNSASYVNAIGGVPVGPKNTTINSNYRTYVDDTNYGLSGTAQLDLGTHEFTSISAWRHWDNNQYQDGDRSPAPAAGFNQSHDQGILDLDQISQELRIASKDKQFIDYVGGLYLFHFDDDEIYRRDLRRIIGGAPVDNFGRAVYGTSGENYAVFGEGTLNFTDRFRAIAGARLSHDELEFQHRRVSDSAVDLPGIRKADGGSGSTDANGFSGRTGLQFDLAKKVTLYGTYFRGYKGPAYNVFFNYRDAYDSLALDPETSDSFEVGLKTSTADDRFVFNVAAFDSTYDDFQANFTDYVLGSPVTRLVNAGTVTTRGLEIDASARVTDDFTLRAAVSNTRARVDDFPLPAGLTPAQQLAADINGGRLPFSPDWKASVAGDYRVKIDRSLALNFGTDYTWQDAVQYDLGQFADTIQQAYGIWNASIALTNSTARWRVALLVKNIADESYAAFLSRGTGNVARIVPRDDSRYIGINVRKDF